MNTNRIKQIFIQLAKASAEPEMSSLPLRGSTESIMLTEPLVLRKDMFLYGKIANEYMRALEDIGEIVLADEAWNKDAVDDLLAKCLKSVIEASEDERSKVIQVQAGTLVEQFKKSPDSWRIDLSVYGMHSDCAGLKFGWLEFLTDKVKSPISIPGYISAGVDVEVLFVRVSVDAISKKAAVERANTIVERHLAVLNALCSQLIPSRTRLSHAAEQLRRFAVVRTKGPEQTEAEAAFQFTNLGTVLLSRADCDAFLNQRGGTIVSRLLMERDSFAGRLISGYETAGSACIELKSNLAFLLFAIALESVILGKQNKSEITYQLSSRVAHLLSPDVPSRRSLSKTVNRLYDLRSQIVHAGEADVAEAELMTLRNICLSTLFALTTSPAFANMKSVEELEQWFNDRMLGAIDDVSENRKDDSLSV